MRKLLLLTAMLISTAFVFAQKRTVSGVVSDANGEPLPGVAVLIKGTSIGAATNIDGKYTLALPENATTLVFRLVGFMEQEVALGNQSTINISLEEDVEQLDEVVITGYGVEMKRDVNGSISTVNASKIEGLPVQSADRALQGRISGVQVSATSGAPGGGLNVRVRGVSSMNLETGNNPLYIVDGIQMPTGSISTQASSNALSGINPNDIESIDILKDPSMAAIYGAQAANGVVLITTKKGKTGKPKVNFNMMEGVVMPSNLYDVMNAKQYAEITTVAYQNDPNAAGGAPISPDDPNLTDTDWVDAAFRNARMKQYDLSISGGSEKSKYYISGAYNMTEGQIIMSDWERASIRMNLDNQLSEKLSISTNLSYTYQKSMGSIADGPWVNGPFYSSFRARPTSPIYDKETGDYAAYPGHLFNYNIIEGVDKEVRIGRTYDLLGSLNLRYKISPSLVWSSYAGINNIMNRDDNQRPASIPAFSSNGGSAYVADRIKTNFNTSHTLSFNKTFADIHRLSVIAGGEYKQEVYEFNSASGTGFAYPELRTLNNAATPASVGGFYTQFKRAGLFGKVKYDYDDRYAADFTLRQDGSSRFGAENQWGTFWAGSLAWRLSSESFLENVDAISNLKLRVSYGVTGNSNGIDNFASRALYQSEYAYNGNPGVNPSLLANEQLSWEEQKQFNLGLDFAFFNNRIYGSIDAWTSDTYNQLLDAQLPTDSGFGSISKNVGNLLNKGLDFEIGAVIIDKNDFQWKSDFNISFLENEVGSLSDGLDTMYVETEDFDSPLLVGQPIGADFYYDFAGINPATGQPMYYDKDGNITYAPSPEDRVVAGNGVSKFYGGWSNTFSYKGFSLEVFFQYDYGVETYVSDLASLALAGSTVDNQLVSQLDYWKTPGQITNVAKPMSSGAFDGAAYDGFPSTNWLSDASYIRLKFITLSYEFPTEMISKIGLSRLNIYAQAQNLLTITNFTGLDPEVSAARAALGGYSQGVYPLGKQFMGGLKLSF